AFGDVGEAAGFGDELDDREGGLDGQQITTGSFHLAGDGYLSRRVIFNRDRGLWISQIAAFAIRVFDGALGFGNGHAGDAKIADELEVDVAPRVDADDHGEV